MGKYKFLSNARGSTIQLIQPLAKPVNGAAELRPRHAADVATFPPGLRVSFLLVVSGRDLVVQPCNDLLAAADPLVPVLPDGRAGRALVGKQLDDVVQLSHALGDLDGGFGDAEVVPRERVGVEVFLEAAVLERAEHARANVLLRQTAKDTQLALAVDQVVDLGPVDAEQEFPTIIISVKVYIYNGI